MSNRHVRYLLDTSSCGPPLHLPWGHSFPQQTPTEDEGESGTMLGTGSTTSNRTDMAQSLRSSWVVGCKTQQPLTKVLQGPISVPSPLLLSFLSHQQSLVSSQPLNEPQLSHLYNRDTKTNRSHPVTTRTASLGLVKPGGRGSGARVQTPSV